MRYLGSKYSTLPELGSLICGRVRKGTFCDPFGGIGTVGAYFKTLGFRVWTGDVLHCAHHFQLARIHRRRLPAFHKLRTGLGLRTVDDVLSVLNHRKGRDGWFVEHYAKTRKFFTLENARSIEHAWKSIRAWQEAGWLNTDEYAVLSASLVQSMDQVANTAGTYYAFLKKWHRKAKRPFQMQFVRPAQGPHAGICHLGSAETLVTQRAFDVLYLDPPYNERSYAHYYHLPETIAVGHRPRVHGASGIPTHGLKRSAFNDPKQAVDSLAALLKVATFKWLAFHYADDGLIPAGTLRAIFAEYGKTEEFILESRGYTTQKKARQMPHRLYLLKHD